MIYNYGILLKNYHKGRFPLLNSVELLCHMVHRLATDGVLGIRPGASVILFPDMGTRLCGNHGSHGKDNTQSPVRQQDTGILSVENSGDDIHHTVPAAGCFVCFHGRHYANAIAHRDIARWFCRLRGCPDVVPAHNGQGMTHGRVQ